MVWTLKKTVVLVGMMGAGKTAVGKSLAHRLGVPFLDSDAEIEAAANMSIAEIFERDGEAFFRKKESLVIERLLERSEKAILSTGGGAFLAERNREAISDRGVSLWLKADMELLWNRVKHKDTRPLLRTSDPRGALQALYDARVPIYAEADLTAEAAPELSIEEMTTRVVQSLQQNSDVLEADNDA